MSKRRNLTKAQKFDAATCALVKRFLYRMLEDFFNGVRSSKQMLKLDPTLAGVRQQQQYYEHAVRAIEYALRQADGRQIQETDSWEPFKGLVDETPAEKT